MRKYYLFGPSYTFKETGVRDDSQVILEQVSINGVNRDLYEILNMNNVSVFEELESLNKYRLTAKFHKMAKRTNIANYRPNLVNCPFALDGIMENALLSFVLPKFELIDLEFNSAEDLKYKLFVFPLQDADLIVNFGRSSFVNRYTNDVTKIDNYTEYLNLFNSRSRFNCYDLSINKKYSDFDMFNLRIFPNILVSEKVINQLVRSDITGFDYNEDPIMVTFE